MLVHMFKGVAKCSCEGGREVASSAELFLLSAGGLRNDDLSLNCQARVTEVKQNKYRQCCCFLDLAAVKHVHVLRTLDSLEYFHCISFDYLLLSLYTLILMQIMLV